MAQNDFWHMQFSEFQRQVNEVIEGLKGLQPLLVISMAFHVNDVL